MSEATTAALKDLSMTAATNTAEQEQGSDVTLENVHGLSIYELRKELERRGEYGWGQDDIPGYNKLLQKLVRLLMADKEKVDQERYAAAAKDGADGGDGGAEVQGLSLEQKLAQKKAMRKAKALQRSRERQAKATYFEDAAAANEKGKEEGTKMEEGERKTKEEKEKMIPMS